MIDWLTFVLLTRRSLKREKPPCSSLILLAQVEPIPSYISKIDQKQVTWVVLRRELASWRRREGREGFHRIFCSF